MRWQCSAFGAMVARRTLVEAAREAAELFGGGAFDGRSVVIRFYSVPVARVRIGRLRRLIDAKKDEAKTIQKVCD